MPKISGKIKTITSDPSRVREIWVQAKFVTPRGENVIVPETRIVNVEDGILTFNAEPNTPGTIVLVYEGTIPNTPIPIFIGENDNQTLGAIINAAKLEKNVSEDAIKALISEALNAVGDSRKNADKALESELNASKSEKNSFNSAEESKKAARESEEAKRESEESAVNSSVSSSSAAEHADNAYKSKTSAEESASSAKKSADSALESENKAKSFSDNSDRKSTEAENSANNAKESEKNAQDYMTRAGKYAEDANRGIPDGSVKESNLSPELATKVNQGLTHVIGDISGLQKELDNKSPKTHKHEPTDINGVEGITSNINYSNNKDNLVKTNQSGRINANIPTAYGDVPNKGYVDNLIGNNYATFSCQVNSDSKLNNIPPYVNEISTVKGSDFSDWNYDKLANKSIKVIQITKPGIYKIEAMGSSNILDGSINCSAYIMLDYMNNSYNRTLFSYANNPYSNTAFDKYRTGTASIIQKLDSANIMTGVTVFNGISDVFLTITKLD